MNERIQQLMKSAITECFDDQLDRDGDLDRMYIPNVFAERFAQLIVAECCVALHPMLRDMISRTQGVDMIVKHFGVEQ